MTFKLASWNVEARLGGYKEAGRGTAAHILKGVEKLDADVLVLLEAYMDTPADGVDGRLKELGYTILDTAYDDYDREDEPYMNGPMHMRILSRLPVTKSDVLRPGDLRNLQVCRVIDPDTKAELCIIATHLDDRSEAARLRQVRAIVSYIHELDVPVCMLGDFNALWDGVWPRFIRSNVVHVMTNLIPHAYIRNVAARAMDMASAQALPLLSRETALQDIDVWHQPTVTPKHRGIEFFPSIRLLQLDHILVSPSLHAEKFTIAHDGGSDHRSILAMITLDK